MMRKSDLHENRSRRSATLPGVSRRSRRSATLPRALCALLLACAACAAHGVTNVVHDAARDLVLNSANKAVYTNFYGGVWSFMRASSYTGARTLMPGVRYRTDTETDASGGNFNPPRDNLPIYWERGPAKGNASPCFSVNPSPWPDTKTFMRGADYPAIQPGELSCHPGNTTDAGNQCVVLRFTVPRAGTYAVTAKAWNRNTGWTAVALLVNGTAASPRKAWKSPATAVVTNDFSLAAATYAAGDTIELTVDGNGTYNSNATGLEFKIAEEVEAVYDASSAFLANRLSENPTNPYSDTFGTWTAYCTTNYSGTFSPATALREKLNSMKYTRVTQGNVLAGLARYNGLPYLIANVSGRMAAETNSAGLVTTATGRAFLPGELDIFPQNGYGSSTILEVCPTEDGIYDVGLAVRDMFYGAALNSLESGGANVWLLQGDKVLAKKYISVERGAPYSSSDTIFFSDVRIMPQIPLAVAVDNYNSDNNSDGVGTHWAFIRKRAFSATYDANAAMKVNMTSASPSNPFTHNGATWTAGLCAGGWRGAFTVYPTHQTGLYGGTADGWGETTGTSPFIRVNTAGRTITATEANSVCDVGIDALMGHPKGDSSATALRFTVPADGIYTATIWAKDHAHIANTSYLEPNDTGVDVHLIAGSRHAAQEIINIHPLARRPVSCELTGDRLYLKAGETVTFAIGSNGAYQWDLTSFYAWLDPEVDAAALQRVNVDLNGAASGETAATFAGAGRVGFAGETWNGVAAADGVAAVESRALYASDGTTRTGAQLAIQRGEDGIAASAANLATDTAAGALFADGVVSTNSADAYSFTLTGLLPNTAYECYFYSRALTNAPPATSASVVRGTFTAGGATATSEKTWFADSFGDYARLDVRSNADGEITGTFHSASATGSAFWCGLQVLGPGFAPYVPKGAVIIIR